MADYLGTFLFGAARFGLKIVGVPARYKRRMAGESKIRVIKHRWLLARMRRIGFQELKLAKWFGHILGKL